MRIYVSELKKKGKKALTLGRGELGDGRKVAVIKESWEHSSNIKSDGHNDD